MKLETLQDSKFEATEKWREYVAAEKMYRKPEYTDLKKVYNQIKSGRKLIDIFKVIAKGGVHVNHHPKLAIAKLGNKKVRCIYSHDGDVKFTTSSRDSHNVIIRKCLPEFDRTKVFEKQSWGGYPNNFTLEAPIPIVPPEHLPKKVTDDYYILWEVDEWKMVPPTDPWLLRRITKTIFVVVSGWDLTDVEKAVMHGRMY